MKEEYLKNMQMSNPMLLTAWGELNYSEERGQRKITLEIGRDFGEYYRSLIPKCIPQQGQKFPSHITVVRGGLEPIINMEAWNKYPNRKIWFYYMLQPRYEQNIFWLDAFSQKLCDIRVELGLTPFRKSYRRFHITIANDKFLRKVEGK